MLDRRRGRWHRLVAERASMFILNRQARPHVAKHIALLIVLGGRAALVWRYSIAGVVTRPFLLAKSSKLLMPALVAAYYLFGSLIEQTPRKGGSSARKR
jgi:hypothetical protein